MHRKTENRKWLRRLSETTLFPIRKEGKGTEDPDSSKSQDPGTKEEAGRVKKERLVWQVAESQSVMIRIQITNKEKAWEAATPPEYLLDKQSPTPGRAGLGNSA